MPSCRWGGQVQGKPLTIQSGMKKTTNHQTREFKQKYGKRHFLRMRATERDVKIFDLSIPENSRKHVIHQVTSAFQDFHCDHFTGGVGMFFIFNQIFTVNLSSSHRRTPRWIQLPSYHLITATAVVPTSFVWPFSYNFKAQLSTVSNGCEKIIQHF